MNDQKQQIIEKLKSASNVLVTVSTNPTVDDLAACIGLTLLLNKADKHATAVFSGKIPDTIEFLNPQKTIEKTTDSLRDFIISLDKSKADKLRYKVEDDVVRVFITPYGTSISEKDLVFSQGDFNVDVVVGVGIHRQSDLDTAISAHGRILHDAVVVCINNTPTTELGTVNWLDLSASSLSELVTTLADDLGSKLLDEQIATALLTGIVAETNHFGNEKTTPHTMTISAKLLEAGANQRLVADKLSAIITPPAAPAAPADGSLEIHRNDVPEDLDLSTMQLPATEEAPAAPAQNAPAPQPAPGPQSDAFHQQPQQSPTQPTPAAQVIPANERPVDAVPVQSEQLPPQQRDIENSLQDLEDSVAAQHPAGGVDDARKAVEEALMTSPATPEVPLEPIVALNAQPVNLDLGNNNPPQPSPEMQSQMPEPAMPQQQMPEPPAPQQMPGQQATPDFADQQATPSDFGQLPVHDRVAPEPMVVHPSRSESQAPAASPFDYNPSTAGQPMPGQQPLNPAVNEPAPLGMSPADQAFTMPLPPASPPSLNIPPPQTMPPTSVNLPPQGPPPPPAPPPMMPPGFSS